MAAGNSTGAGNFANGPSAGGNRVSQNDQQPANVAGSLMEEFGGSVVNVLLGGLLLWVGQTTFEHNGELAGFHQQLAGLSDRHQTLNNRVDGMVESLNIRTRGRFTADDGEKLSQRIDSVQLSTQSLREQWHDRLAELRVQVSALEVKVQASSPGSVQTTAAFDPLAATRFHGELNSIRYEVDRLGRAISTLYHHRQPYPAPVADKAASLHPTGYSSHSGISR